MLLEFKCKNFRSFKDELCFSMEPNSRQKGLDYSIQTTDIGGDHYKSLCSAVIYGPNAAGKTNIISAMDTLKKIILRGNLVNSSEITPNYASTNLELIPNYHIDEPVSFSIKFIHDKLLFTYDIVLDLGRFLSENYERKVVSERLRVNSKELFSREKNYIRMSKSAYDYGITVEQVFDNAKMLAQSSLKSDELFLTNGFRTIFSKDLVAMITNWLKDHFGIVVRADVIRNNPYVEDVGKDQFYFEANLENALNEFGVFSNKVAYKAAKNGKSSLYSLIEENNGNMQTVKVLPATMFESYGTIRFINEFPLIANALANGGTLVIDEFDASIHPIALMSIINVFHNDEINTRHAQLIFNTHNPIFLDHTIFRRDEIKFVEYDAEESTSVSYSLSDFNTSETAGTRKNSDYMKNYFINRYGAIANVDFSSVFKNLMDETSEEDVEDNG